MGRRKRPTLTRYKLLGAGIHEMSLDEVEQMFGQFQGSDRRPRLTGNLRAYIRELRDAGWAATVYINGSFVMPAVNEPDDVDTILVLPADWDFAAELRPFEYNLLWRTRASRAFGLDLFVAADKSVRLRELIEFF